MNDSTQATKEDQVWWPIDSAPEGVVVNTKISDIGGDRNEQKLKRSGRLWFFPDGSMYVYYTPTHWQELQS
jgi:hypothetical protein